MIPSFFTLFKRGKYYHRKFVEDGDEQPQSENEINEVERFAVAAVAFCLCYDELFREHFFEKICRMEGDLKFSSDFHIEVEENDWADLKIKNANITYVVEFKINAPLQPKQNPNCDGSKDPNHNEFLKSNGYGNLMQREGITRYIVFGAKENLDLDNGKTIKIQGREIVCRQCAWRDIELPQPSKIVSDLFLCLGNLGVLHFRHMKANKIQIKQSLDEAVNAHLVLDDITKRFKLKGQNYSDSNSDDGSWWLGFNVLATGKNGNLLLRTTGFDNPKVAVMWFGFQGKSNSPTENKRAVWIYCSDKDHAENVKNMTKSLPVNCEINKSSDAAGAWDVIITNSIGQPPNDCEWFQTILEQLQLQRSD